MQIDVMSKYNVKYKVDYAYVNECGDFSDGHTEWEKEMNCTQLIDFIFLHLKESDFWDMYDTDNLIKISNFNPNTGETKDAIITIEPIREDNNA